MVTKLILIDSFDTSARCVRGGPLASGLASLTDKGKMWLWIY